MPMPSTTWASHCAPTSHLPTLELSQLIRAEKLDVSLWLQSCLAPSTSKAPDRLESPTAFKKCLKHRA